jgi:hypothetical protein
MAAEQKLPKLYSLAGVAKVLGIKKQLFNYWLRTGLEVKTHPVIGSGEKTFFGVVTEQELSRIRKVIEGRREVTRKKKVARIEARKKRAG